MGNKYTEAQKRATLKNLKKLKSISIRIKPEEADRYKNAAGKCGLPLRQFILDALNEKIAREALGPDADMDKEEKDGQDSN